MTIDLNPEQEYIIAQAIQAGLLHDAGDVVDVGIEALRQQLEAQRGAPGTMDAREWSTELHAWIQSHPTTTPLLSDEAIRRDSIYVNRGL